MNAAANSSGLLKDLTDSLGPLSGRHRMVPMARAINLKRVKKFFHRLAKLGALRAPKKIKSRLFKAGVLSTVSYGMEVQGVTPTQILHFRRAAGRMAG
eukprot:8535598-Pyramimonas_sp.AAC.1